MQDGEDGEEGEDDEGENDDGINEDEDDEDDIEQQIVNITSKGRDLEQPNEAILVINNDKDRPMTN